MMQPNRAAAPILANSAAGWTAALLAAGFLGLTALSLVTLDRLKYAYAASRQLSPTALLGQLGAVDLLLILALPLLVIGVGWLQWR
ncbi:MAG TPA: hypothetical protein VGC80_05185, partial [Acetobacteraceae bacterium]